VYQDGAVVCLLRELLLYGMWQMAGFNGYSLFLMSEFCCVICSAKQAMYATAEARRCTLWL
jgi:hypothetical protein